MAKSVTVERNTIITGFSEGQNAPSVEQFIKDATLHEMHAEDKGVAETRGLIGIAQSFNGTSSYIRCPSLIKTPNDQQLTISGWLRREKSGLQENLIGVNGSERSMRFLVDENNSYILRSQSEQVQSSENVAGDGDWAYFTCSYDNSKMRLHINGILAEEKTTDSPIPADEVPVYIGKWLDTYFFEGKIDELWVSDIARSDFWIRLTYENQKENSRMVIVPPRAPRGIQTTLIYPSSVKITWDAGSSIDLIEIERAEINSDTWTRVANVPVISSEFIDNVECGKTFVYRFRYSTSGVASDYSQEETIRLFVCPEEVPSSVTAQPADENSVLLTWIDNATGESGYDIQMKNISEDEFTSISTALPDATTSVIGNLTCNTNYSFRIRVVKGDYSSEWAHSNPVSTEACSNAPRSPSQLTVRFNVNRYVLSWTDNSNDEEYFAIYRAATSTSSVNSDGFELLDIIPAGVTNYEDATYPCGKYLTYKVTAFNTVSGGGLSSPSNSVQVLSAPCTENNGNNLITLSCMLMDDWGNPVTQQGARITVNLYADPLTNTSLYSETFTVDVRNGYLRVNLGTYNDVGEVVKNNSKLYYEVTFNNMRIPLRQPLTSYMNSINNSMMLRGDDSPIGTIDAVPGSLYLNTVSQKLYFKFGPSVNDWKRVE